MRLSLKQFDLTCLEWRFRRRDMGFRLENRGRFRAQKNLPRPPLTGQN
jgi:hypothetical protein